METPTFERAEPDDPLRCTASDPSGQCPYLSVKGLIERGHWPYTQAHNADSATCCPRHGGGKQLEAAARKAVHDYQIGKHAAEVDRFAASENCKTLRGEIGILRMSLQTALNRCDDDSDLVTATPRLNMLIRQIESLVKSCSRLELQAGNFMDENAALMFADEITKIIGKHVTDAGIKQQIANEINVALVDILEKQDA